MVRAPGQLGARRSQHPGARRRLARGDRLPLVQDGELAARPFHHLDLRPGVAGPLTPGQQLEHAPAVLDRVVARDAAGVPEAEDGGERKRAIKRAVGHLGLCRE